jgi:hypothetical protein
MHGTPQKRSSSFWSPGWRSSKRAHQGVLQAVVARTAQDALHRGKCLKTSAHGGGLLEGCSLLIGGNGDESPPQAILTSRRNFFVTRYKLPLSMSGVCEALMPHTPIVTFQVGYSYNT